jgi:trigger factor
MKYLPKSQIELEINVFWKDWEKYLDVTAQEASREIKISGFRPGKAPRNLVEQKVGKGVILNGAARRAVEKSYVDKIAKEKLEVIGSPKVELLEIKEGQDLKYKAVVSVMPEIEIKDKYRKGIKKINEEFSQKKNEIDEKDLKLELDKLAASRVKLITVRREAKKNDSVDIDFEVLVGGVSIENGKSKNHPMVIGRGVFIPGFEEQIIGMKEGEEKEFELAFPENYHQKNLAGKKATFKVKVNIVQERQIPETNDEFAKSLGKFENLESLKKNIREGLEEEMTHKRKEEKRSKQLEEIIGNSEVDLPEILIEEEIKRMTAEFEQQISMMGMNLDQYLSKIKKDRKELEENWKGEARKRVISALALKKIVKLEKLEVSAKEAEEEMNKTLQYCKNVKDMKKNIDLERLYNYSKGVLENEKVFEYLEKL